MFDLQARTILLSMSGSHAYGTNRPDSDVDVKGVCVAPRSYREGFLGRFEQAEKAPNMAPFIPLLREPLRGIAERDGLDGTVFGIDKFFKLASDCNPNVIEILWTVPEDRLICTPEGARIIEARTLFLSRKALYTFRGYAISQMRRIQGHRRWFLDPPKAPSTRGEFGLPERTVIPADQVLAAEAAVQKRVDSWEIDFGILDDAEKIHIREQLEATLLDWQMGSDEKYRAAGRLLGYEDNFLDLLDRERHYHAAQRNWVQYLDWKAKRNPARAAMEAKFGYDGKHALHLTRLMRMCREILSKGEVLIRRPDADELRGFLQGSMPYEELLAWAEAEDRALVELAATSPLPRAPDRVALDELCQEITRGMEG